MKTFTIDPIEYNCSEENSAEVFDKVKDLIQNGKNEEAFQFLNFELFSRFAMGVKSAADASGCSLTLVK